MGLVAAGHSSVTQALLLVSNLNPRIGAPGAHALSDAAATVLLLWTDEDAAALLHLVARVFKTRSMSPPVALRSRAHIVGALPDERRIFGNGLLEAD